ncbi:MAG: 2-hydroxychromene-2-carboxylate isomerase [Brachymonas sp.]|nr:2-hydroxychromene-2-carboxylate isomerase [Brachymonas sp.]NJS36091.1 2-hydroxychromene-2-carboxylate isomerase [Brachymonas sp.]
MKTIDFYFDVISPYAYLAFEKLPIALDGLSYRVVYRPVVFGAILKHFGQLGPAEIEPKRVWTYRQIQWLANQQGVPLQMPASHPFISLQLQRLALACGQSGSCNRYVTETLLRHVWQGGQDAADISRLQCLIDQLQPTRAIDDLSVKADLKVNTDAAIAAGIFGVPLIEVDGQHFWGLDALPLLRAYLQCDSWFDSSQWRNAGDLPKGIVRSRG